jgi:hypothetical protein
VATGGLDRIEQPSEVIVDGLDRTSSRNLRDNTGTYFQF